MPLHSRHDIDRTCFSKPDRGILPIPLLGILGVSLVMQRVNKGREENKKWWKVWTDVNWISLNCFNKRPCTSISIQCSSCLMFLKISIPLECEHLDILKASCYIDSEQEVTDVTVEYISFSPSHHKNFTVDQTNQNLSTKPFKLFLVAWIVPTSILKHVAIIGLHAYKRYDTEKRAFYWFVWGAISMP